MEGGPEQNIVSREDIERRHLLSIFPEEIWLLILDQVDESDLENVSNAASFFRNNLLERRVVFLFPRVWEILANYGTDVVQDRNEGDAGSILKLRLVCTSWRNSLDLFYQNMPLYHKMKFDILPTDDIGFSYGLFDHAVLAADYFDLNFDARGVVGLAEFMTNFEQTHGSSMSYLGTGRRCPILTRGISYTFSEASFNQTMNFLQSYGDLIWYCNMPLTQSFISSIEFYIKLKEMLKLLPNLKTLRIRYNQDPYNDTYERDLEQFISYHPLEPLKNLEYLKIAYLPTYIFNEVIRSNNHVSMLEVKGVNEDKYSLSDGYSCYDGNFVTNSLPNLTQLSLVFYSEDDFHTLEVSQIKSKLTKLYIQFGRNCGFIKWSRVFSLMENKWADTLTNVMISLPKTQSPIKEMVIVKEYGSLRLNLPHVKRLQLNVGNLASIDFLLPMKDSLEHLDITMACTDEGAWTEKHIVASKQIIQFWGYFDRNWKREQKSNIWTLFPKLNLFKVCGCYKRICARTWYPDHGKISRFTDCSSWDGKKKKWRIVGLKRVPITRN